MSPDEQPQHGLHDAMSVAVERFGRHGPDLVARAAVRGRRLRRVRRMQLGAVAVLAVGAAGLGINQLAPRTAAPVGPATAPASAGATPSPAFTPPVVSRSGPVAGQLAAMLPTRGSTTVAHSLGEFTDGRVGATPGHEPRVDVSLLYDDGHGRVALALNVHDITPAVLAGRTCGPVPGRTCEVLPDGTQVETERPQAGSAGSGGWTAIAIRPDGRFVQLTEFDTDQLAEIPRGPATRTDAALTVEELKAVVLSPHWNR
ncbi:hypothetical protein [Kitasatospora sp. NPDC088346]|uniref:hypothetical protein n=1 Tax=Kitasatospora sp. NPDC088346 TaxID=3364073 RepID=UPI0037FDEC03